MTSSSFFNNQFVVFDNVLGNDGRQRLKEHIERETFTRVNVERWSPAWRLEDGNPLQGSTSWFSGINSEPPEPITTVGNKVDELTCTPEVQQLIGEQGSAWSDFSISPWIYPQGTALTLHVDGRRFAGAFVYYLHDVWHPRWGGLLVVLDLAEEHRQPIFDDTYERRAAEPGMGRVIVPSPDRLVYIAPDAAHMITRVDVSAGDRPRLSVGGFFQAVRA